MNWFKKKEKDNVKAAFEEAEHELESYSGQETVSQMGPFQVIKEESGCGSGDCGSETKSSHGHETSGGCGSGGCGSSETKTENSGGCCGGESTSAPVLSKVTAQTTLREAGQNPLALEIMLKSGLPFGCGMKHLSIQEAGKSSGLGAPKIKKIVDEINQKIGNKTTKNENKFRAPAGGKTTGKKAGTKKGKK